MSLSKFQATSSKVAYTVISDIYTVGDTVHSEMKHCSSRTVVPHIVLHSDTKSAHVPHKTKQACMSRQGYVGQQVHMHKRVRP